MKKNLNKLKIQLNQQILLLQIQMRKRKIQKLVSRNKLKNAYVNKYADFLMKFQKLPQ